VLPLNTADPAVVKIAEDLYRKLTKKGLDVLIDDRDERAGIKFKDADLIGIPVHVVVGEKNAAKGMVEVKTRKDRKVELVRADEAVSRVMGSRAKAGDGSVTKNGPSAPDAA